MWPVNRPESLPELSAAPTDLPEAGRVSAPYFREGRYYYINAAGEEFSLDHPRVDRLHPRIQLFTNNRWVSWNVQQGPFRADWSANWGTGAEPTLGNAWQVNALHFDPGTVLHSMQINGLTNNAQATGLDIRVLAVNPTPAVWAAGFDSLAEANLQTLFSLDGYDLTANGGASNDQHLLDPFDLGSIVLARPTNLIMAFRPIGTITATRRFYGSLSLVSDLPVYQSNA